MRIVVTIEARMTSSRLPGKVLMPYCDKSNLLHIVERVKSSKYVNDIVVATTDNITDNPIVELCQENGISLYRGSEDDVLLRVLEAAKSVGADLIVEITGDCPVIDWRHIDQVIEKYLASDCDYCSNILERTYPRGFDVQVFSVKTLERVNQLTTSPVDHEHVSLYIYTHPEIFKCVNVEAPASTNYPEYGITLDTVDDYHLIKDIYEALYPNNPDFSAEDVVNYIKSSLDVSERAIDKKRKDPFKEQKDWIESNG